MKCLLYVLSAFVFLAVSLWIAPFPHANAESAQKILSKEEEIRKKMIEISKQLGVTCNECHNMKNLADDSSKNFQVAREHIKAVEALKALGFDGKKSPEASCFMCHRGSMKYPFSEGHSKH